MQAIIDYGELHKNKVFYRSTMFPFCEGKVFETKTITSCVYSLRGPVSEYIWNNSCCLFEFTGDIFGLKIPGEVGFHGEEYEIILPMGLEFNFLGTDSVILENS